MNRQTAILAAFVAGVASFFIGITVGASPAEGGDNRPRGDRGTTVTEVRLSDGTRCAVMDKPEGAAISCDWGSQ